MNEEARTGTGEIIWVEDPNPARFVLYDSRFAFTVTDKSGGKATGDYLTYSGVLHRQASGNRYVGKFTFGGGSPVHAGCAGCDLIDDDGEYLIEKRLVGRRDIRQGWSGSFTLDAQPAITRSLPAQRSPSKKKPKVARSTPVARAAGVRRAARPRSKK